MMQTGEKENQEGYMSSGPDKVRAQKRTRFQSENGFRVLSGQWDRLF